MTTSTAVVPYFRFSYQLGAKKRYACRQAYCKWQIVFAPPTTRDLRMILLERHLRDTHSMGPLARVTVP